MRILRLKRRRSRVPGIYLIYHVEDERALEVRLEDVNGPRPWSEAHERATQWKDGVGTRQLD
jgi:hypothetical protein